MNMSGLDFLYTRLPMGMTFGLENIEKLCAALGNPEKSYDTIHVVGTNGKGSASYYLAGVLRDAGIRTGHYTSPHLVSVRERIRVDDEPVSEADLDRVLLQVKAAAEKLGTDVSFFEAITAACYLYFREKNVRCAVLEAGLGGRLDSTRVACGKIAVLTSIGLEHTELLGDTESKILREKLGILAPGATAVLGGISDKLISEAKDYCRTLDVTVRVPAIRNDVVLPNLGRHYVENASLALDAARVYLKDAYDDSRALNVLRTRSWAGRMQKLCDDRGRFRFLLDGAHNTHAAIRLAETLESCFPGKKFPCIFGALKDKDVSEMLRLLAPHVSVWHLTRTPYARFREAEDLAELLRSRGLNVGLVAPMSADFLNKVSAASGDSPVLVTGSLYMIGAFICLKRDEFDGLRFFRGMTPGTNEKH